MNANQIGPRGMTAFVPDGDSRTDTAIILIGAAREYGIDDSLSVAAAQGGFWITDELADLLGGEDQHEHEDGPRVEPEPEPEPEPKAPAEVEPEPKAKAPNTSGNRAAKNNSKEE